LKKGVATKLVGSQRKEKPRIWHRRAAMVETAGKKEKDKKRGQSFPWICSMPTLDDKLRYDMRRTLGREGVGR